MERQKSFDCVRMKWEIQQSLMGHFAGLDPASAREAQRHLIEQDGELAAFLKNVRPAVTVEVSAESR